MEPEIAIQTAASGGDGTNPWWSGKTMWIMAGLFLCVAAGTFVRAHNLGAATMGHTEIYVPNIPLPENFGNPRARLTLARTITNEIWEPHPAGWYVLMYGWTKVVGITMTAIRLPSVVFGIASVLLLFALCRQIEDPLTALIAAGFLALNGHQIYWSRIARPSTLVCALGLLSCMCLVAATRRENPRRGAMWLYLVVALAGLASEHYFWLLLAGQMVYCLVNVRGPRDAFAAMLSVQFVTVTLASPLLTAASFQGGAAYLSEDPAAPVRDLLAFGFLFEDYPAGAGGLIPRVIQVLPWVGTGLFLVGVTAARRESAASRQPQRWGLLDSSAVHAAVTVLSCIVVLVVARALVPYAPAKVNVLRATVVVPLLSFSVAWLFRRYSAAVAATSQMLRRVIAPRTGDVPLPMVMATVPFALAAAGSTVTPLMVSRHLLIVVPYVLLLMAIGTRVALRSVRVAPAVVAMLLLLAFVHTESIRYNLGREPSKQDYKGLAEAWKPQIDASDLILVRDHFRTTPLFYYMNVRDYPFVARNHPDEVNKRLPSRIWVLVNPGQPPFPPIDSALRGYRKEREVHARSISADLYVRPELSEGGLGR